MANKHPLAFSSVNGTMSGFFAFITGATTVGGLALCIFGLTSFGFMLSGNPNVSAMSVLQSLELLPNPLEFIRDCNKIMVAFTDALNKLQGVSEGHGNDILGWVIAIATSIFNVLSYVFAFVVSAILLPVYLVYFVIRCVAVVFSAIGLGTYVPSVLRYNWQPIEWLLRFIGAI